MGVSMTPSASPRICRLCGLANVQPSAGASPREVHQDGPAYVCACSEALIAQRGKESYRRSICWEDAAGNETAET